MKVTFPQISNKANIFLDILKAKNIKLLPPYVPMPRLNCLRIVDIYSKNPYPSGTLSNFKRCSFELDGIKCASIEGVIQSLKVVIPPQKENFELWNERMNLQEKICSFANNKAKRNGNFLNFFNPERILSWRGKIIDRWSEDYHTFLKRVFEARYKADEEYRQALFDTRDCMLIHSIGKHDKAKTNLTEEEFIGMLQYLRDKFINKIL